MKRIITLLSLVFLVLGIAGARDKDSYVKITAGPYVTNVTGTSFTVIFTTNMDAVGWVEIAPDDGTHFYNVEREAWYDKRGLGRKPIGKTHKITVSGLEPGTTYRYRAMTKGVLEQEHRKSIVYTEGYGTDLKKHPCKVTTRKENYDKLCFSMVNDVHSADSVFRKLFADARNKYDFVCFNGDMLSAVDSEAMIMSDYMKSAAKLFADRTPIHYVRGNHEYRGNDALKLYDYIDTPGGKTYYSFTYGDFFFLFLDGGEDKCMSDVRNLDIMITEDYVKEEAEWLQQQIQIPQFKNSAVLIAFCHMPPQPKGWYGNATVHKYLAQPLDKAGLDLMLCGHIHKFKQFKDEHTGVSFPVVCNANLERMDVTVTKNEIRLEVFNPDGSKIRNLAFPVKRQ